MPAHPSFVHQPLSSRTGQRTNVLILMILRPADCASSCPPVTRCAIGCESHFCSNLALRERAGSCCCVVSVLTLALPPFVRTDHSISVHGSSRMEVPRHSHRVGADHPRTPPTIGAVAARWTAVPSPCPARSTSAVNEPPDASSGEVFWPPTVPRPQCQSGSREGTSHQVGDSIVRNGWHGGASCGYGAK